MTMLAETFRVLPGAGGEHLSHFAAGLPHAFQVVVQTLGLIQPLDDLVSPDAMTERFPFAAELGTVDNQTAGFVIGADMQHLAYRPSLLDSPPVSWREEVFPPVSFLFPAGGRGRQVDDATLIQYMAAGGKLTDAEGNPSLDEDVLVSLFNFYNDCVNFTAISRTISLAAFLSRFCHNPALASLSLNATRLTHWMRGVSPRT